MAKAELSAEGASMRTTTANKGPILAILTVVLVVNYLDRQLLSILAPRIKVDLALSDGQLGLLGGLAFAILYAIAGIPISLLADRLNRVRIVSLSLGIWSIFTALCGAAGSFASLFMVRVGVGLGEAGGVTPCYSIISDYYRPEQRARAISIFTLGIPVGSALGLLIGGAVAPYLGWRGTFVAAGLAGLPLVLVVWKFVPEPERPAAPAAAARTTLRTALSRLRAKTSFWLLAMASSCMSMMFFGLSFWLPTYFMRVRDLDPSTTSVMMAAITLVGGFVGMPLGGFLADMMGKRDKAYYAWISGIFALAALPGLVATLIAGDTRLAVLFLLVPQIAGTMYIAPSLSTIQHLVRPNMRVTTSAIYTFITILVGLGGGTFLFGVIAETLSAAYGTDSLMLAMLGAGIILYPLASILYFFAGRRLQRDWEPEA